MTLEEQSVGELTARVHLGSLLIKMLHKESDSRAPEAIEVLRKQQQELNDVLVAKIAAEREARGEPPPLPIVVMCKPVVLTGKALRR